MVSHVSYMFSHAPIPSPHQPILLTSSYSLRLTHPTDPQLQALQTGCFRYFQLGGACVDGPVGLLSGLIKQPFVLFYHFFAVALYGMWLYITEAGSKAATPVRAVLSLGVFYKACVVLFPFIFSELRS